MNNLQQILLFIFLSTSCIHEKPEKGIHEKHDKEFVKEVISTEHFEFKDEDKIKLLDFDFQMTRLNYNDSTFLDYPLLCSCDTCTSCGLLFKRDSINWYINADGEWQEFFSIRDSLIKVVYFKKQKFILKPLPENMIFEKKIVYGFCQDFLYVIASDIPDMWFHPDYGVVGFGYGNELKRHDFK